MLAEGPAVEGRLVERSVNGNKTVEGLVAEDTVNKKLELGSLVVKS